MRIVDTIDTRQGTRNQHTIGHGNTLPYTGVPFGMNHFVMQTRLNDGRFFNPDDYSTFGVRLTHQPSPWMGDFCHVLFNQLWVTEEEYQRLMSDPSEANAVNLSMSSYRPDEAIFQPHYMRFNRLRDGLKHEWIVSQRGARWRVKSNRVLYRQLLTIVLDKEGDIELIDNCTLKVSTHQLAGSKYHQFGQYNFLKINRQVKLLSIIPITVNQHQSKMAIFEFDESEDSLTEILLSSSYISYQQAQLNFEREAFYQKSFESAEEESGCLWENYLAKIEVKHRNKEQVSTFYHCLWRTATFPQLAYERDETQEIVHFSPYTGKVERGYFFTNNGYWDTFRTNYPLYTLIVPSMIPKFIDGILSVVREDRYLPKWLSPDERGLMPGTLVDAVIADAVIKNLVSTEVAEQLLDAMIDSANHSGIHETEGREGVDEFLSLGYLSTNYHESVNKTLDFSYSDFCISQVAKYLGKDEIAKQYERRSLSYRNLFNKEVCQMVPKTPEGEWVNLEAHRWGEHYTEGSAWQNSLAVYHNIKNLIDLYGGDEAFIRHLEKLVNQEPIYDVNGYGYEIHEMTEMARVPFGQLALSNQPSFHIPYLFIYAGLPNISQLLIKQLATHLFDTSVTGFIGDEDNGSMSSWYVLSSLGVYPMTPGSGQWTLGINLWDEAKVHLENGKIMHLISKQLHTPYLQVVNERWLNQKPFTNHYIDHNRLINGVLIEQSLGIIPQNEKIKVEDRPFSLG